MTGDEIGDERLAALFRDAAADAPPARFDHRDVAATSRRITARRRSAVLGGAMALLVVAGVGVAATLPTGATGTLTSASAGSAQDADSAGQANRAGAPEAAPAADPPAVEPAAPGGPDAALAATSTPAAPPSGAVPPVPGGPPPLGPGTRTCVDTQDPALRALVVAALPEAATAGSAPEPSVCRLGGERSVSLELGGGVLTVGYLPPGAAVSLVPGAGSAPTASGGTVIVMTPPAYRDRQDALLAYLAPRL